MAGNTRGRNERREPDGLENLWVFDLCHSGSIPIEAHYSLFVPVFLEVYASSLTYTSQVYSSFVLILYGPVLFLTVLIHELGHACAARFMGGTVNRIVLWPMGGYIVIDGPPEGGPSDDLVIAVAGPCTHIAQAGFWILLYAILQEFDFSEFSQSATVHEMQDYDVVDYVSDLASQAAVMNVVLFVLNLGLPAHPLDGGRALAALLVLAEFKPTRAARITAALSLLSGFTMLFFGVYWYVGSITPVGLVLIMVACFVLHAGLEMWKAAANRRVHRHALFHRDCYKTSRRPPLVIDTEECPIAGTAGELS